MQKGAFVRNFMVKSVFQICSLKEEKCFFKANQMNCATASSRKRELSCVRAMASNLLTMASNLLSMASNLRAEERIFMSSQSRGVQPTMSFHVFQYASHHG